mgnify:CR=1 FL=1
MTNKEWLKNITPKDLDLNGNVLLMLDGSVLMLFEDYYWLIKQAKLVQELEQQNKRYQKSIKECVERMNEGGAGTRSFVHEKLIEVLEGEE